MLYLVDSYETELAILKRLTVQKTRTRDSVSNVLKELKSINPDIEINNSNKLLLELYADGVLNNIYNEAQILSEIKIIKKCVKFIQKNGIYYKEYLKPRTIDWE